MKMSILPRPAGRGALAAVTAAVLITSLAGCSDDKETMATWAKKGGGQHATAIAQDVKTLLGASDPSPTNAEHCRQVLDDVKAAKAYRPMPDEVARASWDRALGQMETVAGDCVRNAGAGKAGTTLSAVIPVEEAVHEFTDRFSQDVGNAP
ncbi:hypothetical protein GCM10010441_01580 [Kitasatospora paracochleata]|uniref:Lipoprotein n=1 Tax=Kitasatospora paracochleata TaxID=58354 RepID=A0ABT1J2Q6_9ACTN|nr:hypothetical protein [Kitasatospora paracochleata]MCP2311721.1 hypothetical protein [Kitasatospora paracochleata]